jgi:hypothetical protein
MGIKVGVVILVVAVGAVSAQSVFPKLREEARQPAPRGNSAFEAASKIRDKGKLLLNDERGITRFAKLWRPDAACLEEPRRLIRVQPGAEWPDDAGDVFLVVQDEDRLPLALLEEPISCSGDWNNHYIHYFDANGRTVAFERYSGFFNGCDFGVAREMSVTYYGPKGIVIAREYRLEDEKGDEHKDAKCDFMYRYPYAIYKDWASAAAALGLPHTLSQ